MAQIYPVDTVVSWTEALNKYDSMLGDFMGDLQKLDPLSPAEWVKERVKKFCDKINGALAKLRMMIIKGLKAMYQQALKPISKLLALITLPAPDPFSILGWVGNVVNFFNEPLMTFIQFISDCITYTPPLVGAAGSLAGDVTSAPATLQSILEKLAEKQAQAIANAGKAGVEAIDIHMDPITLGDIIG